MNESNNYFRDLIKIQESLNFKKIDDLSSKIISKLKNNKKIFLAGNGGSAYNSSHFVTDWVKFSINYENTSIFSLNDNLGLVTAYANDLSYKEIFSEQLKKFANENDFLLVLSGSGNSKNLINAVNYANINNIETFGILGFDGGELKKICSDFIHIESSDMQFCEDIQIQIGHYIMKKIHLSK